MLRILTFSLPAVLIACTMTGCDSGEKVRPVDVEIKIPLSPLEQMIRFLDHYAKGNPMGSEVTQFESLLEAIRGKDPAKADLLKTGFEKLKKAGPAQLKSEAAALIKKISPNTAPTP